MGISENLSAFAGRPVRDWTAEAGIADPRGVACRLTLSYDEADGGEDMTGKLAALLGDPAAAELEALVIGAWNVADSGASSEPLVAALAAARDQLPALRHLFLGDISSEECEISWIVQCDVLPLFEAYPRLETLVIRGGTSLGLGSPRHDHLRTLILQAGGLPRGVVHEVSSARLPALEHLELWLGDRGYEGDATTEDLAPILRGDRFPKLRYLGLKNSEIQDEVAAAVALAPVTKQLEVLDLSMGTLGDDGAKALLASPAVRKLKRLDVHHHFVSPAMVAALKGLGIEVDASDEQSAADWGGGDMHRFVEVSE